METFNLLIYLTLCIHVVFLIIIKLRKVKSEYQPYFAQLNLALKAKHGGASAGIIDMDRLDWNVQFARKKLGDGYKLRLVTKSLASLDLLKYLMVKAQANRLMVFSEPFIAEIVSNFNPDSLDILLGTPLPVDAFVRLATYNGWNTINWLIDTKERLNQYLYYAQKEHIRIKINLEIDVGLHRGGFETTKDFAEAVEIIKQNSQYLELTGLMGYDGHVLYVPFLYQQRKVY
jgi:D-serine deaminase-like pyridoxal phosphate-dependent protein